MTASSRAPDRPEILRRLGELAAPHIPRRRTGHAADRNVLSPGPWRAELRLIEDLGLDSIALLALVVEVENGFEVALEPEDEAKIATVGDLVATIERLQQEKA